jgi:hypothetical protein
MEKSHRDRDGIAKMYDIYKFGYDIFVEECIPSRNFCFARLQPWMYQPFAP